MKQDALQQTSKYAKAHQRKRRWYKAVSCLAAVVVFCTTYALILPAITMEQDAKCGIPEHVHDESCYIVVSEPHVHDESCYELVGGHAHTDDCYTLQRGELICGQEERKGHHHTDACYTETTTLVCGLEEDENHQHTAACYETTRERTCGLEESGGHQHTDECYAWEQVLTCGQEECEGQLVLTCNLEEGEVTTTISDTPVCGLEEHTHTLACCSDPAADVETAQIWERAIKNVELTGDWREDVIAIAKTQLGYQESTKNYIVLEVGETIKGYTRYGAWYGDPYGDWCAMFASFVLNYAEVEGIPLDANCQHWIETLSKEENDLYRPADEYLPQPGDLIFFDFDIEDEEEKDEAPTADHVGLVVEIMNDEDENPIKLKTIEGNSSDKVQYVTYDLDDPAILGYGQLPEQEPEDEEPIEEPAEQFVLTAESEDGIAVTVTGDPESLPCPAEEITLSVRPVTDEETIALWNQTLEEAGENAEEAFLLDIALLHDGEEIEPTGPVQVTFEGVETGDNDELTVFHVDAENEETEDMNAVVDEAGAVVLDTDHFSVYGGLVSVSGVNRKPQAGEYIYLDMSAVGSWSNDGWKLGLKYNNDDRGIFDLTSRANSGTVKQISNNLYRIQLPGDINTSQSINVYRSRNSNEYNETGRKAFISGSNYFAMSGWADNAWKGNWVVGKWYIESLADKTMAFENNTGTDLTDVKAIFYDEDLNELDKVTIGKVNKDGGCGSFYIPTNYGTYVRFVDGNDDTLGDEYSNFLAGDAAGTNGKSFLYDENSMYCYKYNGSADNSKWGVPGFGEAIYFRSDGGRNQLGALANSGTYYLAEDVDWGSTINITGDVTLDLKGHKITSTASTLFHVTGTLTIIDTGTGTITDVIQSSSGSIDYGSKDEDLGSVTYRSGSYTNGNETKSYKQVNKIEYYEVTSSVNPDGITTNETQNKHQVTISDGVGGIYCTGTDSVIKVDGGTLNIEGGTYYNPNGQHTIKMEDGKDSTFNFTGGIVCGYSNWNDVQGNGIYVGGGRLNISGDKTYVVDGACDKGGGIYLNTGTINMSGGVVAVNRANFGGGIYVNSGTLNLTDGKVATNRVYSTNNDRCGGGIYVNSGTLSMSGGYVTCNRKDGGLNNSAGQSGGGGIAIDKAKMYMSGGYITGNYSQEAGGGVYAGFWHDKDGPNSGAVDVGARFVMSGGTVASNYAQNGEGGGIRIAGGAQGEISAPTGSSIYITNNKTHTENDWGGGGIFVQTDGLLNILDVLITQNSADGFGGGVAACPSGDVDGVKDKGAAIFDNTAKCSTVRPQGSVKDYDWQYKDSYTRDGYNGGKFRTKESDNGTPYDAQDYFTTGSMSTLKDNQDMIGGGNENWSSSGQSAGTVWDWKVGDTTIWALTSNATEKDKADAKAAASVYVTGNWSNTHGGGITTNGDLDMGKTTKTENPAYLTLSATKQVQTASYDLKNSGLEQFTFALLNTKPTWDKENSKWLYDESAIVQVVTGQKDGQDVLTPQKKQNDPNGNISFDQIKYNSAGYYTYYLIEEKPGGNVKGEYEQDPTLYTILVQVTSTTETTTNEDRKTKKTEYWIEKIEVNSKAVDTATGSNKTLAITNIDGGTTFTNKEVVHYELPSTGSTGTTPYTTGGLLLMVSASALLLYNHQKRRKEAHASS